MKTILLTASFIVLASTAFAQNFTNNTGKLVLEYRSFDLAIDFDSNEFSSVEAGITVLPHSLGVAQGDLRLSAGTFDTNFSNVYAQVAYNVTMPISESVSLYAINAVQYRSGGVWQFEPTIGVAASVTNSIGVFAEVSHAWEYQTVLSSVGGELALGADFAVTNNISIRPTLVRPFNNGTQDINARVEAVLRF
jgi:hypothetical protein